MTFASLITGRLFWLRLVLTIAAMSQARTVMAQAWVLPERTGAVTFVWQRIDHAGRMRNDGTRAPVGQALNFGVDVELDYAFTDRWSVSTSLPFVMSKFTDPNPPPAFLPFGAVDACRCWQNEFADFGLITRYNLINVNRTFMVTPFAGVTLPSHAYEYAGEAVVGKRLKEFRVGTFVGQGFDRPFNGVSVEAGYGYSFVERVLDVPNNRSNGSMMVGFALPRGWSTRFITLWQRTHGGLRFPVEVNVPALPERLTEFHRMLRDNSLRIGAGVTYSRGGWDFSTSMLFTARGSNAHDIHVFSVTAGRLFEFGRP